MKMKKILSSFAIGALAAGLFAPGFGDFAAGMDLSRAEAAIIDHGDTFHYGNTEAMKAYMQSIYGENQRITGSYDKSLAVKCVNGTFVGERNGEILSFKGIPFVAEQPVGKNRFKRPVPFAPDDGVYEARYFGKACAQAYEGTEPSVLYKTGEDCLYLNIWKNTEDKTEKKPVMVWIHGGAYQFGGTMDPAYDGHNFLTDNPDVILVTVAYRVGALGFCHLSHLPGGEQYPDAQNNGILDQIMALKWVHENIAAFGGDPDNVTIFGQSAGGGSVSTLSVIPEARQYFQRVIAQSGSNAFLRKPEMAMEFTRRMFEKAGVDTLDEFLALPLEKVIDASTVLFLRTVPERDGKLIPYRPFDYMASGAMKDIDFMEGTTHDEANYYCFSMGANKELFTNVFSTAYGQFFASIEPEEALKAREFMKMTPGDEFDKLSTFCTQTQYTAPVLRQSEELAKGGGKVFHYQSFLAAAPPGMGAMHSQEVSVVFNNLDYQTVSCRDVDRTFARTMQRMWVNFAKKGNPSLTAEESPTGKAIKWEPYNTKTKPIMSINEFDIHMSNAKELKITDWERVYPLTKYYFVMPAD